MLAYIMENQVSLEIISPPPKEAFKRAFALVRNQTAIREDIIRFSMEAVLRLQEERGPIMLYGL